MPASDMHEIMTLVIGERFDHELPDDGMSVIINGGTPVIVFNFSLMPVEIKAFQNGDCSFGLFAEKDLIFFLLKIDGFMEWLNLAFTIHLADDEKIEDEPSYLPFSLVLLESQTNIIKGLRMVTVSPTFRQTLAKAIDTQAKNSFNPIDYYNAIGAAYKQYPSVADMLNKALIVEQGGITLPE